MMAGTIPISMTQQFSAKGVPLVGGKLYIFQTATLVPQNAYSDSGLTAALSNPMTLDSSGRVPQFFLADGTVKARLTDSAGTVQAEWDNLLVIGPTGGGGGGGATVDTTTIFQTGDPMFVEVAGTRSGWVRDNGRTIGSATSGASERANSDCQALFVWLWQNFSDSICPVVGGRGATASADWSANKQITLVDKRGVSAIGLDDMGNSPAGKFTGVVFESGNATTAGSIAGENAHALTSAENGPHTHGTTEQPHTHSSAAGSFLDTNQNVGGLGVGGSQPYGTASATAAASTGLTIN
jgi:hypothetical protein